MNKKLILFFVVTLVVCVVFNILAGPWIAAKLSFVPIFRKYQLFNPQAPIVITKKDDSGASSGSEMTDAIARAKSHLSSVVTIGPNSMIVNGGALNLSTDGYFLTVVSALAKDASTQSIVLNNGQSAPITAVYGEPGSNLVIVKASLNGVAVVDFASSKSLLPGTKIGFAHNVVASSGLVNFQNSFVSSAQNATLGKVFNADKPSRSFAAQPAGSLIPGEAVIGLDGKIAGLWDGNNLVSADVANQTVKLFFNNSQKGINRPMWKFSYRNIGSVESNSYQIPIGALVASVDANGPAAAAGLKAGDSVTAVGGQSLTEDTTLEELLANQKPGQSIAFTVVREKKLMTLTLTPTQ